MVAGGVYCHISLSNQKLCIQFGQPTGPPTVPDFKAFIMTLQGQLKQASLFFYYAAGNPLKSSIDSLSNLGNKVWMLWLMDSQPLSLHAKGYLLKQGPIFNTMLIKSEYSWLKRKKKHQDVIAHLKQKLSLPKKIYWSSTKEQKIPLISTHNKTWPPPCSHIKACWKEPESAAHLSRRARRPSDRRRSLSLDKFIHYSTH